MNSLMRLDGRTPEKIRNISIIAPYQKDIPGSCLVKSGDTWVCCSVSVNEMVPYWLKQEGHGWLTAEYGMLPGSSSQRIKRERNQYNARAIEIGRLIGRSLRASINIDKLPLITLNVDCDVIQADGGTRTASITGGFVALCMAIDYLLKKRRLKFSPLVRQIAGLSGGSVRDKVLVDLNYEEDSKADFDANFVFTKEKDIVEIQSTAESYPISSKKFFTLFDMMTKSIDEVFKVQDEILEKLGLDIL